MAVVVVVAMCPMALLLALAGPCLPHQIPQPSHLEPMTVEVEVDAVVLWLLLLRL